MLKSDVRAKVRAHLTPLLSPSGFRWRKDSFVRKIPLGSQSIALALWDYPPVIEFTFVMTIRLDDVEEIFNRFSGAPLNYQHLTTTTLTQLEHLVQGPYPWRVQSETDLKTAMEAVAPLLLESVIPFLDQHCDLPSVAQAVIDSIGLPQRTRMDSTQDPSGAMHALILAARSKSPELQRLVHLYEERMANYPEAEREKFRALARTLLSDDECD